MSLTIDMRIARESLRVDILLVVLIFLTVLLYIYFLLPYLQNLL